MLDWVKNKIGAAIGWAEDHHLLWYPVKHYMLQVSPDLWRGSRLRSSDYQKLVSMGIRSVVIFCKENDMDHDPCIKIGLIPYHIPDQDNTVPSIDDINTFLAIMKDSKTWPVYCHCEAGLGRTGVFVACYRIAIQGWTNDAALQEAVNIGLVEPDQKDFISKYKPN